MKAYEYYHIVSLEETNSLGNVYFSHYISWQGKCREQFLYEKIPTIIEELSNNFTLITLSCSCEYLAELVAFDSILLKMFLDSKSIEQNKIHIYFEYWKIIEKNKELVAKGEQWIVCMNRNGNKLHLSPIPEKMRDVFLSYTN